MDAARIEHQPIGARRSGTAASRMERPRLQMRFLSIWIALAVLVVIGAIFLPRSIQPSAVLSILPFAAFLAIAAMGQAIVIMARGIDLSVPAIVTLSSTVLLGVSSGSDDRVLIGIVAALAAAVAVGLVNGLLVALIRLNALIVTLATGAIVAGITLSYRQGLPAEATVPRALARFGEERLLGLNHTIWVAIAITLVITFVLRKTVLGRNFEAVGANPAAAHASGLEIVRYQCGAFVVAALLYGIMGILISAFIRNPTLEVGNPYLLAPIAAAVLGATSIKGGIGSMVAVLGAALFLTQLGQMLKLMGLATSYQMIIQGIAIALGMWLSGFWERRSGTR
jgi:ribose transport system permease protein